MAFDRIPFGVTEADTYVEIAAAQSVAYSPGVQLNNPRYGAAGFVLEVGLPLGGVFGAQFDAIVQTADFRAAGAGDWYNTNTRENNIAGPGVFSLQVTDPVIDLLRIQLDAGAGILGCMIRTHWLADRTLALI